MSEDLFSDHDANLHAEFEEPKTDSQIRDTRKLQMFVALSQS